MPIIQLTTQFVANCPPPPEGKDRIEWACSEVKGLFIEARRSTTAAPTWYVRLRDPSKGTNVYRRLGTIKELSLTQARKLARQIKAEHAATPKQPVEVVPAEMTLDELVRKHYMPQAIARKRSHKRDDQLYRLRIAPRFGHLPLSAALSRRAVEEFGRALLAEGLSPASSDHHLKLMKRIGNLCVQWAFLDKNPLKGIPLFMVNNEVENYLDEAQTQKLLQVLKTDANRNVCHILMFLISTGARLNEALTATWKNVSIEGGVWKVDATRSKSKKIRSIPLNDSALWVLEQLPSKGKSDYLFPSPVTGKPYITITRAWYRIRKLAGVNVRIHDLRHSFASRLVCNGRSLYEVQQILGHSDPKVTMRYAHLSAKALQEAANAGSVIVPRSPPKAA